MLYRLARTITHEGYDITFARIGTENSVALDTFHIETIPSGGEIGEKQLHELHQKLESIVVTESEDEGKDQSA